MKAHPQYKLLIEGHCDERDTIEYNLALGERRAKAVLDYLTDLGIPASRMRKISYGEERPVDPGHDETAWRRISPRPVHAGEIERWPERLS